MPPYSVLYIDDEPDLLALGKTFLESMGDFDVETRQSGEETLEILRTHSYDAIISDYQMRGMDGLELLKTVRERFGHIPFILFTGRGREAVVIEAINHGVDFYLQKGGDPRAQFAELAHKVRMAVGRTRAEAALRERDAQLVSLSDNLPSGLIYQVMSDPEGNRRFVHISAGVEKLHEVKPADVLRDPSVLYSQILPEYRSVVAEAEKLSLATMTPFSAEFRTRSPSGTERWILIRSAPRPATGNCTIWDGIELDITAGKQAEEEIHTAYSRLAASQEQLKAQFNALEQSRLQIAESEEKYRTLVDHTSDAVFIAQDDRLVFVNSALASLSGYAPDEIIGKPFVDLIVPEDRELVLRRHRTRLSGDTLPESYGFTLQHKDKKTRIRVNIRVGAGTYHGRPAAIGTLHDITAEERQESALAESDELHRKMVAASPDIIVRVDLEGNIIFMNDRGVQLAGATSLADIFGKSMFSFFAPESLPSVLENTKLMFGGPLGPKEYTFIAHGGRKLTLEVNGDVLRTPEGTPYGMFFICRDASERKRSEEALRKSEEEYRNIIENMQDVFYRVNRAGIITMISPYGARLVGYDTPEEICGKISATDFYADACEQDRFLAYLRREKKVTGYPLTLKDRNGNLHYATASSRLLTDEDGNIDGVEGILHDITHLRQVEDALRQANRQISLMTSITRHDIRNQLMVLMGYLELSRHAAADPVRAAVLIAKEQQAARTIEQQINFTTIFDGMGERPPLWQDPLPLVEKAKDSLPFRDIRLDVRLSDLELFADPLLEKVFYNIFDDALKYGGDRMTAIRVSTSTDGPALRLVIEDDGVGIPKNEKSQIFERGFGKNTGLGLFLVKEILGITGITIRETGVPGSGARFEVIVPKGAYRITTTTPA
jgi:PAS domain S-box-containing protein